MIAGMPWWLYIALAIDLWGAAYLTIITHQAKYTFTQVFIRLFICLAWPVLWPLNEFNWWLAWRRAGLPDIEKGN